MKSGRRLFHPSAPTSIRRSRLCHDRHRSQGGVRDSRQDDGEDAARGLKLTEQPRREAEQNLVAANAQIGVAKAAYFPHAQFFAGIILLGNASLLAVSDTVSVIVAYLQ